MRFKIAVIRVAEFEYSVGILDTKRDMFTPVEVEDCLNTYPSLVEVWDDLSINAVNPKKYVWEPVTSEDDIFIVNEGNQYSGDEPVIVSTVDGKRVAVRPSELIKAFEIEESGA